MQVPATKTGWTKYGFTVHGSLRVGSPAASGYKPVLPSLIFVHTIIEKKEKLHILYYWIEFPFNKYVYNQSYNKCMLHI